MKYIIFAFFIVMSVISVILTVYDKLAAKRKIRRIPEKTLLLSGLLGGAGTMFITMLFIRHKTRHTKFMVGLPAEIIIHIAIITAVASII